MPLPKSLEVSFLTIGLVFFFLSLIVPFISLLLLAVSYVFLRARRFFVVNFTYMLLSYTQIFWLMYSIYSKTIPTAAALIVAGFTYVFSILLSALFTTILAHFIAQPLIERVDKIISF